MWAGGPQLWAGQLAAAGRRACRPRQASPCRSVQASSQRLIGTAGSAAGRRSAPAGCGCKVPLAPVRAAALTRQTRLARGRWAGGRASLGAGKSGAARPGLQFQAGPGACSCHVFLCSLGAWFDMLARPPALLLVFAALPLPDGVGNAGASQRFTSTWLWPRAAKGRFGRLGILPVQSGEVLLESQFLWVLGGLGRLAEGPLAV